MPRGARIVIKDYAHHVTQRGNNKQEVFFDDEDHQKYLFLMEKNRSKYGADVLSYNLMPNHIHFAIVPRNEDTLCKVFRNTQMLYTQYFNEKYGRVGHLWQSRFFSCVLEGKHLYNAVKYIESNAVRAGFVKKAEEWKWVSVRSRLEINDSAIELCDPSSFLNVCDWRKYINEGQREQEREEIRKHTLSGKPLGSGDFLQKLEGVFGKRVMFRAKGRPKIK